MRYAFSAVLRESWLTVQFSNINLLMNLHSNKYDKRLFTHMEKKYMDSC